MTACSPMRRDVYVFVTLLVVLCALSGSHAADCRKCKRVEKSDFIDCAKQDPHKYICRDDGDCIRKGLDCCCLNLCGGTQCVKFPDEDIPPPQPQILLTSSGSGSFPNAYYDRFIDRDHRHDDNRDDSARDSRGRNRAFDRYRDLDRRPDSPDSDRYYDSRDRDRNYDRYGGSYSGGIHPQDDEYRYYKTYSRFSSADRPTLSLLGMSAFIVLLLLKC